MRRFARHRLPSLRVPNYGLVARRHTALAASSAAVPAAPPRHANSVLTTDCAAHVGQPVRVSGWVQSIRQLGGVAFVLLRDSYSTVQLTVDTSSGGPAPAAAAALAQLKLETVISASGVVRARGAGLRNEGMLAGGVEVAVSELEILNPVVGSLPIPYAAGPAAGAAAPALESPRLQHRHIDLRRLQMQSNLRLR